MSGGREHETDVPARFAAVTPTGIFGRLSFGAGRRARTELLASLAPWAAAIRLFFSSSTSFRTSVWSCSWMRFFASSCLNVKSVE